MQIDDLLITESQLSTRLNKSVHEQRRGEFSLLLAMLSQDALDFSQFHFPKTDIENPIVEEETLRKQFGSGPKQPLAPDEFNMLIGQHNAALLSNVGEHAGMSDIKLRHCLNPEPLSIRNDLAHIPLNVLDNCELAVRRRIKNKETQLSHPQMDVASFYDGLNDESLHQPLHLATA
ncbi:MULTISPECIES: VC2046/SO_2500 family protein [Pseudoalteromonas]|uniref:QueD like 2 n=1 Tax=Pseudoalteromonas fuliginea TaxID=1872678 RepID=A0ABQ6RM16_9GAMM|nr:MULTISPECIES: VC2046/SO_2500 family protein [Pseudoalteromonas]KAA1164161.1 queD like 2 [Pseudoalteromonas fuliginea]KAA1168980.1 queD like 2 [Pseudoalteromonas fuliginea]MDQ2043974.1 queD like 2 [Pseudoalteromonas sp. 20-92]